MLSRNRADWQRHRSHSVRNDSRVLILAAGLRERKPIQRNSKWNWKLTAGHVLRLPFNLAYPHSWWNTLDLQIELTLYHLSISCLSQGSDGPPKPRAPLGSLAGPTTRQKSVLISRKMVWDAVYSDFIFLFWFSFFCFLLVVETGLFYVALALLGLTL